VRAYADVLNSRTDKMQDYERANDEQAVARSIINKLNQMACRECTGGEFITLFYAVIDSAENTLTYCSCGHEPGVLIRDGRVADLDKGGLVLGVMPDAEYEIETVQLKNGDVLLLYTDGLIDAPNFEGQFWGRERMLKLAVEFSEDPADRLIKNILGNRRRFVGLASQCDDTSMIVVKVGRNK
jgi:sigma-B regulation protein RsbU (phosphoserine phosphatase)